MLTAEQLTEVVELAKSQIGAPYIWRGKGDQLWAAPKPLPNPFGRNVFDCSGLVTWAIEQAGGPDMRFFDNAQTMFDHLRPVTFGVDAIPESSYPFLAFFGQGPKNVSHIGIRTNEGLIESAGGGGNCTTLEIAKRLGACVRLTPPGKIRRDLVGYRLFN